jgi:hypothetical protein
MEGSGSVQIITDPTRETQKLTGTLLKNIIHHDRQGGLKKSKVDMAYRYRYV